MGIFEGALNNDIMMKYPIMMKFGTVIPYLVKIQKIYESSDTPPDFF